MFKSNEFVFLTHLQAICFSFTEKKGRAINQEAAMIHSIDPIRYFYLLHLFYVANPTFPLQRLLILGILDTTNLKLIVYKEEFSADDKQQLFILVNRIIFNKQRRKTAKKALRKLQAQVNLKFLQGLSKCLQPAVV